MKNLNFPIIELFFITVFFLSFCFVGRAQTIQPLINSVDKYQSVIQFVDYCEDKCPTGIHYDSCCVFVKALSPSIIPTFTPHIAFPSDLNSRYFFAQVKLFFEDNALGIKNRMLKVDTLKLDLVYFSDSGNSLLTIYYPFRLEHLANAINSMGDDHGIIYKSFTYEQTITLETMIMQLISTGKYVFHTMCPDDVIQCDSPQVWTFKCTIN